MRFFPSPPAELPIQNDHNARHVFAVIGRWKRLDLQDLEAETGLPRCVTLDTVHRLKQGHLVAEQPAPIAEFTIYYLTPQGVSAYAEFGQCPPSE